jgi:choline kinase
MEISVLMAGEGKRFTQAYGDVYKPFVKVRGKTILEWTLSSLSLVGHRLSFTIQGKHEKTFNVSAELERMFGHRIRVFYLDRLTRGNLETAYNTSLMIGDTSEILFLDGDNLYNGDDLFKFINEKKSISDNFAALTAFEPIDDSAKWCFLQKNKDQVTGIYEKDINALKSGGKPMVGVFYFSNNEQFLISADKTLKGNNTVNGEYYLSSVVKTYLKDGIDVFGKMVDKVVPLGTPEDVEQWQGSQLT